MTRVGILRERANNLRTLAQSFDSPTIRADLLVLAKRSEELAHAAEHKAQIGNYVARLVVLVSVAAATVPFGSTLAQNTPQSPMPVAAQSTCPKTMPDVDQVACWVSVPPQPVPAERPPLPLLRGSDGTTIIGPKPPG